MKLREILVGDVRMSLAEAGTGGVPLLLVHGFTGAKEDFTDFLDAFASRGWHVVAPDLRGHGASGKPKGEHSYSLDVFATDALALADELGWDRFALLGHSMGGMVAQVMALRVPQRIHALVLMNTSPGGVDLLDPAISEAVIAIVRTQGMSRLLELSRNHAPLANAADARVRKEREDYVEFGERKLLACSPAMCASILSTFAAGVESRLERFATLTMPTLVVVGELDTPFRRPSKRMAAALPDGRLSVLPDAGHSPQFEAPDAWWQAISHFLDSVAARRPKA